jgi:hypothetical protein
MRRFCLVAVALVACASQVRADRIAPIAHPVERALRAPVVVVGKVTAVEKDTVDAPLYPGATNKVAHKIAVVKVGTNLIGAENLTHIKIGFVPSNVNLRRGPENPELKEGQEWLFFLTKNEAGNFLAIPYMTPPVEAGAPTFKDDVAAVKKVLAVFADPVKALKAEKAAERFDAALALVTRFRTAPEGARGVETVAVPADESKLILKALAEGEWVSRPGERMNGLSAFFALGLTDKDGWKQPQAKAGEDFAALTRTAFAKWLAGPGKDYQIKKFVAKK